MADREVLANPVNAPQPVTWFVASYYPSDADNTEADEVGSIFRTYDSAVTYARTKLAAEGVGVVYIQKAEGSCVYNLFDPEPN
jgi:hypothetical protein